jgi:hypothetical protein
LLGKDVKYANKTDNMRLKAIMTRLGWKATTVATSVGVKLGRPEQGYAFDP